MNIDCVLYKKKKKKKSPFDLDVVIQWHMDMEPWVHYIPLAEGK